MTYIVISNYDADGSEIDSTVMLVDTVEQCKAAQAALREAGLSSAEVWVGDPEGESGETYKNGQQLFALEDTSMSKTWDFEITDERIKALRSEAGAAGDYAQMFLCNKALDGDDDARAECARVIADAAAQGE